MRLLLAHSGNDLYGASRSFLRLSTRLVADGHSVLALLPYEGPLVSALDQAGVEVKIEPMTILTRERYTSALKLLALLFSFPRSIIRLRRIIKEFNPDVVHTNTTMCISTGPASWICRVPHLWHVRESFGDFRGMWPIYQRFIILFSDRVACVSSAVAAQFRSRFRHKTIVIHNGFPRKEFDEVSAERTLRIREKFHFNGNRIVGLVGRIKFVRKGQEVFVRAAAKIKDQFPDATFVCIGSPFPGNEEHLSHLQQLTTELDLGRQFLYTGDIDDIKAAYSIMDISVLASAQPEPFGGVVIESMAMGLPVIGTAVGGTLEQIVDGVTGYLVPPGDADAMAQAMVRLLNSSELRKKFGQAGRERFLAQFEFEPFYKKIISIYEELAFRKSSVANA